MERTFNTIDLFAGAGGITEGFRKAGAHCLCANDFDLEAMHTFTYNHPNIPYILKDVRELSVREILETAQCTSSDVDVITGGPPCQGFSLAGQRISNDPRNTLFREYVRIAKEIKPKVIFFENVYGILSMQGGLVLQAILREFTEIGYSCKYAMVNAADYGVPQARPRFVLLCARGTDINITFPDPTHQPPSLKNSLELFPDNRPYYISVEEAISDLPIIQQGEGEEEISQINFECKNQYQKERMGTRNPSVLYNHRATKHAPDIVKRYSMIPQGGTNTSLPIEMRTKKQNVFRLCLSQPSRTVTCNFRTDLLHPTIPRGLTVREAARLQSFDDDYRFFGNLARKAKYLTQDDQVGNAVPPLLAYAFAEHIKNVILPQFNKQ